MYLGLEKSSNLRITNIAQYDVSVDQYTWPDFSSALSFSKMSTRNFPFGLIGLGFHSVLGLLSMM